MRNIRKESHKWYLFAYLRKFSPYQIALTRNIKLSGHGTYVTTVSTKYIKIFDFLGTDYFWRVADI